MERGKPLNSSPISTNERIISLDIIRGFAIFGIFLVNMPAFHSPDLINQVYGMPHQFSTLDQYIRLFFDLFVQGKFYTIFSFLFGLGFYIFMSRAEQKGQKVFQLFSRRLIVLLIFGALHLTLLWYGDILHTYAIAGFLLMLFYKLRNKTIIIWAFSLMVLYYSLIASQLLLPATSLEQSARISQQIGTEKVAEAINIYQNASYVEWLSYRMDNEVSIVLTNAPFVIPTVLAMFLFGLYAGRRGVFQQVSHHIKFIKNVWIVSLILSIPLMVMLLLTELNIFQWGPYQSIVSQLFVYLSGTTLCFFYISSIVLLLRKESWRRILRPFSYVGQMALTNYILQTVISVSIFVGLDLFGEVSLAFGLLLCLIVFPLQIVFSYFWLKRFRFGPLEWLWRSFTYLQTMKLTHTTATQQDKHDD